MNVFLDMVGCRLNQSEIESFASQFRLAGHTLVSDARLADLVVINTCTVTSAADSDSRQKIRRAVGSGAAQVFVTGCYATLNPNLIANLPGITQVIDNRKKDNLVPIVLDIPATRIDNTGVREPIPGARLRTRAFIKAQDGCDNHCTYCITRLARGAGKSRTLDGVLLDVQSALAGGCQEIVLTGVHLGSWGHDFESPSCLLDLVKGILDTTQVPRLHLSSIEPWDISPDFFDLWQDDRLCRHLHLPLQSGCAATLKRMGRKVTLHAYADLVENARRTIPGISITTDIITGFPGETEDEFIKSLAFVQQMNFAGGHVFTYSPRPGTPAVHYPDQIHPSIGKRRNAQVRQLIKHSACSFQMKHLGQTLSVLWEKARPVNEQQWEMSGLSDNYLRVHAVCSMPCYNQVTPVQIKAFDEYGLLGEILP